MELATRPCVAAGVVLAAAGMIAATPAVSPSLPAVHMPTVQLTAGSDAGGVLADLLGQQLASNSALIDGFLSSNAQLLTGQTAFVDQVYAFLKDNADLGLKAYPVKVTLEQFFDANNAMSGAGQASLLGLLGARGTLDDAGTFTAFDPAALNTGLIIDAHDPDNAGGIPFAGLESAIGHYLGAAAFSAAIDGSTSGHEIEGGTASQAFEELVTSVTNFNTALVTAEHGFNTTLVTDQVNLEEALFGTASAYNGVVNRAFNAVNMMFDAQQQSLNGLLGITGYDPQDLTGSLLTGTDAQVFNDGGVGGLLGAFDQSMAMWANVGGLLTGAGTPTGFEFDPDAVHTALSDLFTTLGGGPFGDVFASGGAFSDLLTDLGTMFTSFFG